VFFQTNYDKIELKEISYDVISVTLSVLRHRKNKLTNITKLTSQRFSILGLSQSKFLATPVSRYHVFCVVEC